MKSIKKKISFSEDLDYIVNLLDENLVPYIEILKEAVVRGSHKGWAYNSKTLKRLRVGESKHLEDQKKKLTLLDDLTDLGYIHLTGGFVYDDCGIIKDSYSVYTISSKGKEFLKKTKQIFGKN